MLRPIAFTSTQPYAHANKTSPNPPKGPRILDEKNPPADLVVHGNNNALGNAEAHKGTLVADYVTVAPKAFDVMSSLHPDLPIGPNITYQVYKDRVQEWGRRLLTIRTPAGPKVTINAAFFDVVKPEQEPEQKPNKPFKLMY